MEFNTWRPSKVRYTSAGNDVFETASAGFWQNRKVITKNGQPYAELEIKTFKGQFFITFLGGPKFLFRRKSFWNTREFIVTDSADTQVATIRSPFTWKIFKQPHFIDINEALLTNELNDTMPFIIIYCRHLVHTRQAGGA